jgi:hypothetical protein
VLLSESGRKLKIPQQTAQEGSPGAAELKNLVGSVVSRVKGREMIVSS